MTKEELLEATDVPTLHSVVKTGDKSIIQTTRQEQISEQDAVSDASDAQMAEIDGNQSTLDLEDELELLIDDVVDRHIIALRKDIRTLLEEALAQR